MVTTELAGAVASAAQAPDAGRTVSRFDFRRTDLFGREAVRALEAAHELFTRRAASELGSVLRGLVRLESIGVDQVSYDAYLRSMPNPNVLAIASLAPLPGKALLELNPQLALAIVDRMLGGQTPMASLPAQARRPTELETALLTDLAHHVVAALGDTVSVIPGCQPALESIEYNPQLVQVAAPSDQVLVLSYRLVVSQGVQAEGLVTMCYPAAMVSALLEHLRLRPVGFGEDRPARNEVVAERLADVDVTLTVELSESQVSAADLATLAVGDVLRLDHRAGHPVYGSVAGAAVVEGHLGRRGRRLAFQVARWLTEDQRAGEPEADRSSA